MAKAFLELDDSVAEAFRAGAEARQLPLASFLQKLAETTNPITTGRPLSEDELERAIDEESSGSPVLAADFSRADIYNEHD